MCLWFIDKAWIHIFAPSGLQKGSTKVCQFVCRKTKQTCVFQTIGMMHSELLSLLNCFDAPQMINSFPPFGQHFGCTLLDRSPHSCRFWKLRCLFLLRILETEMSFSCQSLPPLRQLWVLASLLASCFLRFNFMMTSRVVALNLCRENTNGLN